MRNGVLFLILSLISVTSRAQTTYSAVGGVESGKNFSSYHLDINADRDTQNKWYLAGWGLSLGSTTSKYEDQNTGQKTEALSQDVFLGFDLAHDSSWLVSISGSASETPKTKFTQSNGDLYFQYTYDYNQELLLEGEEKKFSPHWSFGLGGSQGTVEQTISLTILSTTVERDVKVYQTEGWACLGWVPSEKYSLNIRGSVFSYSKTKAELKKAFQSRFLSVLSSDLVANVGALPEASASASMTYRLNRYWDITVSGSETEQIVDNTSFKKTDIVLTYGYGLWEFSVGGTSQVEPTKDSWGLLEIGYSWY